MFSRWIYMVFAAAQLSDSDRVCRGGKWTTANKLLWKRMKKTWNGISSKQAALLVISAHIFHVFYYFFESFTACLFFCARDESLLSVCCWMSPLLWVTCKHEMSWVCRTHSRSPASEFVALKSNVGHLRVCRISLFAAWTRWSCALGKIQQKKRHNTATESALERKKTFIFIRASTKKILAVKWIIWWGERAWKWKKSEISRRK